MRFIPYRTVWTFIVDRRSADFLLFNSFSDGGRWESITSVTADKITRDDEQSQDHKMGGPRLNSFYKVRARPYGPWSGRQQVHKAESYSLTQRNLTGGPSQSAAYRLHSCEVNGGADGTARPSTQRPAPFHSL